MRWRVVIAAVLVIGGLTWLAARRVNGPAARQPAVVPSPSVTQTVANATEWAAVSVAGPNIQPAVRVSEDVAAPHSVLAWEKQRDALLTSSMSSEQKAGELLALLPGLATVDQEEAAKHLVNLLSDDHFTAVGVCLTNAAEPEAVVAVLMADLLNRPEKVKLPLCLAIARTPGHPRAEEALKLLGLHFVADHGTNWPAWEAAVQERLQSNP
ncbi:MAG: hypothetical protein HZA90_00465 [Verrucomicrobia bacterium]|nr:hypothetical protein [Verrucomicrobiota bacterium]